MERFEELVEEYGQAVESWSDEIAGGWQPKLQKAAEVRMDQAKANLLNAIRELL